jgi:RNA polymerase sigma-70 factor (ECF subfamily)
MDPSDDDLIAACAAGDREAFGALYRRRRADVYRFALHMTGSRAAAEDIAQDVFLVVMRQAHRYRGGEAGCVPWLLGIARNYVRRHMARRVLDSLHAGHERAIEPEDPVARDEQLARLRTALLALPRRYREAVVLCELQELSYVEAARAIGCALGTVRSRLHRGRARLAAALKRSVARAEVKPVPKWIL